MDLGARPELDGGSVPFVPCQLGAAQSPKPHSFLSGLSPFPSTQQQKEAHSPFVPQNCTYSISQPLVWTPLSSGDIKDVISHLDLAYQEFNFSRRRRRREGEGGEGEGRGGEGRGREEPADKGSRRPGGVADRIETAEAALLRPPESGPPRAQEQADAANTETRSSCLRYGRRLVEEGSRFLRRHSDDQFCTYPYPSTILRVPPFSAPLRYLSVDIALPVFHVNRRFEIEIKYFSARNAGEDASIIKWCYSLQRPRTSIAGSSTTPANQPLVQHASDESAAGSTAPSQQQLQLEDDGAAKADQRPADMDPAFHVQGEHPSATGCLPHAQYSRGGRILSMRVESKAGADGHGTASSAGSGEFAREEAQVPRRGMLARAGELLKSLVYYFVCGPSADHQHEPDARLMCCQDMAIGLWAGQQIPRNQGPRKTL